MARPTLRLLGILLFGFSSAIPSIARSQGATPDATPVAGGVESVANGLTNPRGFTWDEDGTLYLALAGTGGDVQLTVEATPIPFMGGDSSSVATIADGCASPVVEGIGSLFWTDANWTWGAMDVVSLNGEVYTLVGGGFTPEAPNGIYRLSDDGALELVADLGTWSAENPTSFIPPDDDPAGSWFDLETDGEMLWATEAVRGQVVTVTPDGEIERFVDLSEGHMVPTGLVLDGEGGAYVTFETVVPYPDGTSKVVHVSPDGSVTDHWTGLTAVTDLVMGPDGVLYASEMATNNLEEPPYLNPGTGRIVRQTGPDSLEEVAIDVDYPVFLGFADDGYLYATLPAFGQGTAEGLGSLVRIDVTAAPVSLADIGAAEPTCSTG